MSVLQSYTLSVLPISQVVLIAILAAAVGWYVSKEYHELKATRRRQQEIVITIFISILSILGLQKAMKTYRKLMETGYANISVYNQKSNSAADRGKVAACKKSRY